MKTGTLFTSKLLTKSTVLTISAHPATLVVNKENIKALLEEVMSRERQKENPTPWIDDDIVGWFANQTMPAIDQPFDSAIYRFNNIITNGSILDEAEKTGVKKIYTYTESLKIALKGVLSGEVDEKGTGITAYFQVHGNDSLFRFTAWRLGDGRLDVGVDEVSLVSKCDAGDGACFSN